MSRDRLAALRDQRQQQSLQLHSLPTESVSIITEQQEVDPEQEEEEEDEEDTTSTALPLTMNYHREVREELRRSTSSSLETKISLPPVQLNKILIHSDLDIPFATMVDFFDEIANLQSSIREAQHLIVALRTLRARLLSFPSTQTQEALALTEQLHASSIALRTLFSQTSARIKVLEQGNANFVALAQVGATQLRLQEEIEGVRVVQVAAVKERFKSTIADYSLQERASRAKEREQMERAVRTVRPDVGVEELQRIVGDAADIGGMQLFSQALLSNGQRSFAARGALREAEARAIELRRIEQTLTELAQLFNDLSMLVEAQDVVIVEVEKQMVGVSEDMESGVQHLKEAVVSARSARRQRWWIFTILMILFAIVLIVVVVEVVLPAIKKSH